MTDRGETICPLCKSVQAADVLVCTVCNRDISIPVSLKAEYDDLLVKRELLRGRIETAKARIAAIKSRTR